MAYTEVTTQSWGSRLVKSIKSVLVGLFLFVVSFPLLFWNEGRAVQTAQSLEEGAGAVKTVPVDKVEPGFEGKLVHTTGDAKTDETLRDPELLVSAAAIKLERKVEMYQWEEEKKSEEKKKVGGSTETITTYDYKKTWSDDLIHSSNFKQSAAHSNPGSMPYESKTWSAKDVTVGAFTLSPEQIAKIDNSEDLTITAAHVEALPKGTAKHEAGQFYIGDDPGSPEIGDVRISYELVKPGPVSLVGVQTGKTFAAWQAPAGDQILLLQTGTHTAEAMFKAAQEANVVMTWILRLVGFVMMFAGLTMVFKPVSVMGDVVPLVGTMLGAGLGLFAFVISAALSVITVGVAWLFYRPVLGAVLLAVSVAGIVGLVMLGIKRKKARAAVPSAA
ncbi:MAG: TMEM43 family protein [Myxococcales bacterium]|nr:TMEM43 family protein [Myxococcales bacterium]